MINVKYLQKKSYHVLNMLQLLFDIAVAIASLYLLLFFNNINNIIVYHSLVLLVTTLMIFTYPSKKAPHHTPRYSELALSVSLSWLKVIIMLIFLAFITKTSEIYSRAIILSWFVISPIVQVIGHLAMEHLIRAYNVKHKKATPCIIAGNSTIGKHISDHIKLRPWMSQNIIGAVCDDGDDPWLLGDLPKLGNLNELYDLVKEHHVERIYFVMNMQTEFQLRKWQVRLINLNIDIIWVPNIFGLHIITPRIHEISGIPLYYLSERSSVTGSRISKLLMDKILTVIALILLAPFMLIIALIVKLSSPGPVLFRQERHGLNNEIFEMLKFRSMYIHTEDDGKITQASRNDPRVTAIGRLLRRSSMDELPQLFNVLMGDMSLVGPRPHAKEHNLFYADKIENYMSRHKVRPGLTGLAQVNGYRGETDTLEKMERRLAYDLAYINNWSIWLDIRIMIKTVYVLFSDSAY